MINSVFHRGESHFETYRQSGADLIFLQELTPYQATALADNLQDVYPYRALFEDDMADNGLLSKYPILEYDLLTPYQHLPFYTRFVVEVEGRRLTLINVHSAPPAHPNFDNLTFHLRNLNTLQVVADAAAGGEALIVAGDLNATDQSADYALLRGAGLEDAFRMAGWGFGSSWPRYRSIEYKGLAPPPLIRIDYIFISPHFAAERVWVGGETGSDHLPVLADLLWLNAP